MQIQAYMIGVVLNLKRLVQASTGYHYYYWIFSYSVSIKLIKPLQILKVT
ncbi:hypothetical protein Megvenef_01487 [Candidatus Megaera venefica]|uniref:Uncharacterized protein n=1 Tax=Candidatus Megaera venefica TaxID=2055910 RepID=A0ABU5NEA7_9RICK|nr:hypothetical protein [Candidatus Megaera venefica]